jgi:hypothetical protein
MATQILLIIYSKGVGRQVQLGGFVSFNFSGLNFPKPSRVGAARQKVINNLISAIHSLKKYGF